MLYDALKLYIIHEGDYKYICEKISDDEYEEVLTKTVIEIREINQIKPYVSIHKNTLIKKRLSSQDFLVSKLDILKDFAKINSHSLSIIEQHRKVDDIIKEQEEYSRLLKELSEKNPEKAKEIVILELKRNGK